MLHMAVLVGVAAMSANAGVRFGFPIGLPLPVVVATPLAPVPVTVVRTVPVCPGVAYVWAPGYWSHRTPGYAWVPGAGCQRPVPVAYGHCFAGDRW
jgi:hypothetical protein